MPVDAAGTAGDNRPIRRGGLLALVADDGVTVGVTHAIVVKRLLFIVFLLAVAKELVGLMQVISRRQHMIDNNTTVKKIRTEHSA